MTVTYRLGNETDESFSMQIYFFFAAKGGSGITSIVEIVAASAATTDLTFEDKLASKYVQVTCAPPTNVAMAAHAAKAFLNVCFICTSKDNRVAVSAVYHCTGWRRTKNGNLSSGRNPCYGLYRLDVCHTGCEARTTDRQAQPPQ
jgi:hypothetical protein